MVGRAASLDQDPTRQPAAREMGHQSVDTAQERRLSRPGGPDHQGQLPFADLQVDMVEGGSVLVGIGHRHVLEADHRAALSTGAGATMDGRAASRSPAKATGGTSGTESG